MQGEAGRTAGPARGRDQVMIEKRLSASNPPATTSAAPSEDELSNTPGGQSTAVRVQKADAPLDRRAEAALARRRVPGPADEGRKRIGQPPAQLRGAEQPGPGRRELDGQRQPAEQTAPRAPTRRPRSARPRPPRYGWTASSSSSADISYTVSPVTRRTARLVTSTRRQAPRRTGPAPGRRRGRARSCRSRGARIGRAPPPRAPQRVGPALAQRGRHGVRDASSSPVPASSASAASPQRMATSRALRDLARRARRPSPAWPSRGARSAPGSPPPADEARGERHRGRVARTAPSVNQLLAGARRCRDRRCCVEW